MAAPNQAMNQPRVSPWFYESHRHYGNAGYCRRWAAGESWWFSLSGVALRVAVNEAVQHVR